MNSLTQREKILLALLGVALLGAVIWGSLRFSGSFFGRSLGREIAQKSQHFSDIQALSQEWQKWQRVPTPKTMKTSLTSFMERTARRMKIKETMQLNVLSTLNQQDMEGLQVRFDKLNLDEFFELMYYLENHEPVLLIQDLEVAKSATTHLLRVSFRIYKQTNGS